MWIYVSTVFFLLAKKTPEMINTAENTFITVMVSLPNITAIMVAKNG
jgi:hypothetical protein